MPEFNLQNIDEDGVLTDQFLLESWQNGDSRAFEVLYKKHVVKLLTITMQKIDDRLLAEELVNDAFMHLFKKRQELPVINSVGAYLYVMIKRNILDHYRHEQIIRKHQDHLRLNTGESLRNPVFEQLETKELERQLEKELEKIPLQSRTVFTMRRVQELSNKEIASQLRISENTVEQHMRKALKILRVAFDMTFGALIFILIK